MSDVSPPPPRSPIDWEQAAAEQEARRKSQEAHHRRRVVATVLVTLGALAMFAGIAASRSGANNPMRPSLSSTTVPAPSTTLDDATEAPSTTQPPAATGATTVSVFQLEAGMCIENPELSSGLVTDLKVAPCDVPHSHEVFFKVAYQPPGGAFDAASVSTFADEQCAQAFTDYVGLPYDRSAYYFLHLAPSAESWNTEGDRDVVCLLFQQGTPLTGSAKGTAR